MSTENERPVKLHQLTPGTLLSGRYRINKILGEGGFGITYSATDEVLLQDVAIKEYFPSSIATRNTQSSTEIQTISSEEDEQFSKGKQDFLKEARTLARFPHDTGIVAVRDYFEENNTAYIVMELLYGTDLRSWLIDHGPMSAEQCFSLLSPIMTSLSHVHEQGLIHRDISPSNIMITSDGTARLLDFGAARSINKSGDLTLSVLLKPGYSPEEQYRSKGVQGPWTDVYSLCATFYRMLTGMQPEDSLQRLLLDELKKPSELGISVQKSVEDVLMKGLSINGKDRYQSMDELKSAFEKAFLEDIGPDETETDSHTDRKEKPDKPDKADASKPAGENAETRKKSQEKSTAVSKKTGILIAVIAAAAILILIPVIRSLRSGNDSASKSSSAAQTAQAEEAGVSQAAPADTGNTKETTPTETLSASTSDESTAVNTVPAGRDANGSLIKTVFWGTHTYGGSSFSSGMHYMDVQTGSGLYNVSILPNSLTVMPDTDPDTIILGFLDKFDVAIYLYGKYDLVNNVLTVSAPDSSAVEAVSEGTVLYALSEELKFDFSFGTDGSTSGGPIHLTNPESGYNNSCYYYNFTETSLGTYHVSGALSSGTAYKDLQYAKITYQPESKAETAVLCFTDGGITLDARVYSYYRGSTVNVYYSNIQREYNGRTETFTENGNIHLKITNCYPYGFVLYDEDTGTYYYYQNYSEPALSEDITSELNG